MLIVHALITTQPGSGDLLKPAAMAFAEKSRSEDGCESYRFYEAIDQPDSYIVVEQWRDEAALEAHGKAPHYAGFLATVGAQVTSVTITVHDVASSTVR